MQWKMLQMEDPEDFVIATGRMESVRRFCELTANKLGWQKIKIQVESYGKIRVLMKWARDQILVK